MSELNKSDHMLFINEAYLQYKDMKENDILFRQQFSKSQARCLKEIDNESHMRYIESAKLSLCDDLLNTRGGNANNVPLQECLNPYSPYNIQEYLLIPCTKNTYNNYIVSDQEKVCSKRHQTFNNLTKRRNIHAYAA